MLSSINSSPPPSGHQPFSCSENGTTARRKRRPAGTPDPDAEVVSLFPKTLLESDRYVCDICNQGFQRDQNLQMHRRRHKVPWKLLKRVDAATVQARKRVFVCPEPTCLHHDPAHALGDLVGIKKHFRRKHSDREQWVCEKCAKGYAVQSDYKAHLKTCGTRGHSCDCGRVFSRAESFIEHQDVCTMQEHNRRSKPHSPLQPPSSACLSRTASSPTPKNTSPPPNLELQLSIGSSEINDNNGDKPRCSPKRSSISSDVDPPSSPAEDQLMMMRMAMAEKDHAEEARRQAKRQMELADEELAAAKRIRRLAQAELETAWQLKEKAAAEQMSSSVLQMTCHSCKQNFQRSSVMFAETSCSSSSFENPLSLSYISVALKEWEVQKGDQK